MYEINLLGAGQVSYDGKAITGFPGQQPCLLFCYLLLNRQIPHSREQIASVFWGDRPSSVARKNLRNSLWRLSQSFRSVKASLEDLITMQEDWIIFTKKDIFRLDIDEFEAASRLRMDNPTQELSAQQVLMMENSVELYRGDLLEGVYEDWCVYERERLHLAFLNMLMRLMEYHGRYNNQERGLEYGQRILALDPTREKVHRQMMLMHWMLGNREAALLQFNSCRKILGTELGLEPMQETRHLYETIQRTSYLERSGYEVSEDLGDSPNTQSSPPLKEMLQKLHFLEMIVEQINIELHLLERMLQEALQAK